MKHTYPVLLLLTIIFSPVYDVHGAEELTPSNEKSLTIHLGYFLQDWNTELRVDNQGVVNPMIDLEEKLGLDTDNDSYLAGLSWRFAPNHRVSVDYFDFNRSNTATINEEILVDENTFPVGASVQSGLNIKIVPISYSYSFINNEKWEVAGTLGVHWTSFEVQFAGDAYINNQAITQDVVYKSDVSAPLPLIGIKADYFATERWSFGIHGEWFKLGSDIDLGDVEGELTNLTIYTEFRFTENISLGLRANSFDAKATLNRNDWEGEMNYDYSGPEIYLKLQFR